MYGPLHRRNLEKDKCLALKQGKGYFDSLMTLSHHAKCELQWWLDNVEYSLNVISHLPFEHVNTTDASLVGWGAEYEGVSSGGNWTHVESKYHINNLEMLAVYLGLQTFAKDKSHTHIRVMCDNTTAVNIINNMGTSHSDSCNSIAKEIWEWCITRDIWLSVAHIPGKHNLIADFDSRRNQRESEWKLDNRALLSALQGLDFTPDIDLFASRINHQLPKYVSYRPDLKLLLQMHSAYNGLNLNFMHFHLF